MRQGQRENAGQGGGGGGDAGMAHVALHPLPTQYTPPAPSVTPRCVPFVEYPDGMLLSTHQRCDLRFRTA